MKRFVLSTLLCLSLAAPPAALAREAHGVKLDDTVQVGGKELKLNGAGLRRKFIFNVYVAGLYLEAASSDAGKILAADAPRVVKMHMVRDLSKEDISKALREGFEANAGAALPTLQPKLDTFIAAIPAVKNGDVLTLSYVPGKGTTVTSKTGQEVTVEGKDFADALFSIFIGAKPVDGGLKDGMLGKS
jgi:hypothetical protein